MECLAAAQDEREWRRTAEQGAEHFMINWIVAEKAKPELRHAMVCPNVTGRTKERITQSKRARAGSLALALLTSHKWRELVSSGRLIADATTSSLVLLRLFCFASIRLYAFVEAAALRSIVLRYTNTPIATCASFFFPSLFCWR